MQLVLLYFYFRITVLVSIFAIFEFGMMLWGCKYMCLKCFPGILLLMFRCSSWETLLLWDFQCNDCIY